MFCSHCGSQLPEGAKFCQKCGARLIPSDSAQISPGISKGNKKKSKKIPIILGAVVLVVILAVVIALNWEGKTDYVATVKAHTPFADGEDLPYTYEEVLDKYIVSPEWKVREEDDIHYVDISGTIKGKDNRLAITIKVSPDPKNPGRVLINPASISVDSIKTSVEDEMIDFLYNLFYVYDEGYDDLSWLNTDFAEMDDASMQSEPETVDNGAYAEYEERARLVLFEWFDRHPLRDSIKVAFMNEIAYANTGSGGYLVYEMFTIEGEEYGMLHVSPDSGEILMDYIMDVTGQWSPVQITMDQWYLEYYWGWTDDSGYYSEDYNDDCIIIYDGMDSEIIQYRPSSDSYVICNYDGQCLIEYDDGTEESEVSISDFTGIYSYDASIEAEGGFQNFYYQLEIGKWDGYTLPIIETWRGNTVLDGEWARPKSLIVDTLTFDIFAADGAGYEPHSLTYIPAKNSPLGKDVILIDGDNTMPFVRE